MMMMMDDDDDVMMMMEGAAGVHLHGQSLPRNSNALSRQGYRIDLSSRVFVFDSMD